MCFSFIELNITIESMTKGSITKNLILFAIPLFFGQLLQQLYNVVDSVVVGNVLGKEALAAVTLPICMMLMTFC